MNKELILALEALEQEKRIKKEVMFEALEAALVTAYKKNFGSGYNCFAEVNRETGDMRVYCTKTVVEEVEDPFTEITLEEAQAINKRYSIGDSVDFEASPAKFGRIAAQTAKQMVVQKIREAESGKMFTEYRQKVNSVVTGIAGKVGFSTISIEKDMMNGTLKT